jgi:hypothetical protein
MHFVPGGNEKMIAKALTLPADGLILDLEDAVAPDPQGETGPSSPGGCASWISADASGGSA